MPELVVASFNAHAGVDGWGRPYDLSRIVDALSADVVVLQESWSAENGESLADQVATMMGGTVVEITLSQGVLAGPHPSDPSNWGPPPFANYSWRALRLKDALPPWAKVPLRPTPGPVPFEGREPPQSAFPGPGPHSDAHEGGELQVTPLPSGSSPSRSLSIFRTKRSDTELKRGKWKVAVISRPQVRATWSIDLGQLRRDPARRGALIVDLELGGEKLSIVGTHLSHLTHGSPFQLRRLYGQLPPSDRPAILCGDMNLWGPIVSALLPKWRRAVVGRTWPSWAPHSQLDHIFVTPSVRVVNASVLDEVASDHRPIRATLQF